MERFSGHKAGIFRKFHQLIIFTVISLILLQALAEDGEDGSKKRPSSMNKAGDSFLAAVRGRGPPLRGFDHVRFKRKLDESNSQKALEGEFNSMLKAYAGYIVCLFFGAMFIVLLPAAGIVFCCRKCFHCCGSKPPSPMDSKHANIKRIIFGLLLFVMCLFMILCVSWALRNNDAIVDSFKSTDKSVNSFDLLQKSLSYLEKQIRQLNESVQTSVLSDDDALRLTIRKPYDECFDFLRQRIKEAETTKRIIQLSRKIAAGKQTVDTMIADTKELHQANVAAKTAFDQAETEIAAHCGAGCKALDPRPIIPSVQTSTTERLQTECENLRKFGDYMDQMKSVADDLTNIGDTMRRSANTTVEAVVEVLSAPEFRQRALNFANESFSLVLKSVSATQKSLGHSGEPSSTTGSLHACAKKYDGLRMFVCVFLATIVLIVAICYVIGLVFGFGKRPYPKAGIFTTGIGAHFLMGGAAVTFSVVWIPMLLVSIFFVIFGLLQTEVCHFVATEDVHRLQQLDDRINHVLTIIDNNSTRMLLRNNITLFKPLLNDCAKDPKLLLVDAFHLDRLIKDMVGEKNFLEKLNAVRSKMLERGKVLNFDEKIVRLEEFERNSKMDYSSDASELGTLTQTQATDEYFSKAAQLNGGNMPNVKKAQQALKRLSLAVSKVLSGIEKLKDLQADVKEFRNALQAANNQEEKILAPLVDETIKRMQYDLIHAVAISPFNGTTCHSLSSAMRTAVRVLCIHLLQPINGYWYGLGLALWLTIPALLLAMLMSSLYLKTEEYNDFFTDPDQIDYRIFYSKNDDIPMTRYPSTPQTPQLLPGMPHQNLNLASNSSRYGARKVLVFPYDTPKY